MDKKVRDLSSDELEYLRHRVSRAKGLGMNVTHIMLADKSVKEVNKLLDSFLKKKGALK